MANDLLEAMARFVRAKWAWPGRLKRAVDTDSF
jgi:hypothetical protein